MTGECDDARWKINITLLFQNDQKMFTFYRTLYLFILFNDCHLIILLWKFIASISNKGFKYFD